MTLIEYELKTVIYCMEQMQSDFDQESPDYQDWFTALRKLDFELNKHCSPDEDS